MLAKLSLTSPESRLAQASSASTESSTVEPQIIGYSKLKTFNESEWAQFVLSCDKEENKTTKALHLQLVQQILSDQTTSDETKLNAFYFLRSQNQDIQLDLIIVVNIRKSKDIEAWAALLCDENAQATILSDLERTPENFDHLRNVYKHMKENGADASLTEALWNNLLGFLSVHPNLSDILVGHIAWIIKNEKEKLTQVIEFLFNHPEMEIKKQLIDLALKGVYKLTILREALASFTPTAADIAENPLFNVFFIKSNLIVPDINPEVIINAALEGLKTLKSNPENPTDEVFKLFIRPALEEKKEYLLFTLQRILSNFSFLCGAFIPLMSSLPQGEAAISACRAQVISLVSGWDFDSKLQVQIKKEFPQFEGCTNMAKEGIRQDSIKNVVRDIVGQVLLLLTFPGVWDAIVENDSQQFSDNIEKILAHDTKDFFRSVSTLLWNQETRERICSEKAIDWLFSLDCMQTLSFIQPDDLSFVSNGGVYLTNFMVFNDDYVISKLYAANNSPDFLLFRGLTKLGSYAGVINKDTLKYNILPVEHIILPLLTHPDFNIENYYADASENFKQLPQVKAAMQLRCFFYSEIAQLLVGDNSEITNIGINHNSEIFFNELRHRYLDDLQNMTQQLAAIIDNTSTLSASEQNQLTEKAISLHEKIKKLPFENKQNLNQDLRFVAFAFAYRILANKEVDQPTQDSRQSVAQSISSGIFSAARLIKKRATQAMKNHTLVGKAVKTPFLAYVLRHLLARRDDNTLAITPHAQPPFIWGAYVEYVQSKRAKKHQEVDPNEIEYSIEKMTCVNTWLNEQIIETENAKETETLALLPEALRSFIFAGTTLTKVTLVTLSEISSELLRAEAEADVVDQAGAAASEHDSRSAFANPLLDALHLNSLFNKRASEATTQRPTGRRYSSTDISAVAGAGFDVSPGSS